MKACKHCGGTVAENAMACPHCGGRLGRRNRDSLLMLACGALILFVALGIMSLLGV